MCVATEDWSAESNRTAQKEPREFGGLESTRGRGFGCVDSGSGSGVKVRGFGCRARVFGCVARSDGLPLPRLVHLSLCTANRTLLERKRGFDRGYLTFVRTRSSCTSSGCRFERNCFTEMSSGSEAGSYFRLKDFVCYATLGWRVLKKQRRGFSCAVSGAGSGELS